MKKTMVWIATGITLSLIWGTSWGGSIFSMGEMGVLDEGLGAKARAMGGPAIALVTGDHFGRGNPALLGDFTKVGIHLTFAGEQWRVEDEAGLKGDFASERVRTFQFGVPVGYGTALSFGFFPYSEVQFDLADSDSINGLVYDRHIQGSGGLRSISLEAGKRFGDRLLWGLSAHRIFGTIRETYLRDFGDASLEDTRDVWGRSHAGWQFTTGVVYEISKHWSIAGAYAAQATIDRTTTLETNFGAIQEQRTDEIELPASLAFGIAGTGAPKLLVHADVKIAFFEDLSGHENARNTLDLSMGMESLPARDLTAPYYRRIPLRLGFRWRQLPNQTGPNEKGVDEVLMGCGFGLPLAEQRGMLDVSFEVGKRGILSENGAEEVFYRQTFSFSGWEKWFERKGK
ncbi:MAG: hypothetical protein KAJ05_03495 [Candidatus Latescibacteria bacterium]|nr:hypothetical protein [Candidatus Latescibacterota bacterium]